jgi:hypothetical protein
MVTRSVSEGPSVDSRDIVLCGEPGGPRSRLGLPKTRSVQVDPPRLPESHVSTAPSPGRLATPHRPLNTDEPQLGTPTPQASSSPAVRLQVRHPHPAETRPSIQCLAVPYLAVQRLAPWATPTAHAPKQQIVPLPSPSQTASSPAKPAEPSAPNPISIPSPKSCPTPQIDAFLSPKKSLAALTAPTRNNTVLMYIIQ